MSFQKDIYFTNISLTTSYLSCCRSFRSKPLSEPPVQKYFSYSLAGWEARVLSEERGPTALHSSTLRLFLLGGTLGQISSVPDGCPPKAPELLWSLGFQMFLLPLMCGNMTPAFFLPSMHSAVRLYSDMLFGMLLIYVIIFIFHFDPQNRHYSVFKDI